MIANRIDLIEALTDAAEVEHSVCCAYQFAAYSLKVRPEEGGVDWADLEAAREWKATLLLMARQEMEHLGIVADLLTALGGAPYFGRPDFPYVNAYMGGDVFELQRFGVPFLERFICLERPEHISPADSFCRPAGGRAAAGTVGELYDRIRSAFERLPRHRLLIGDPSQQVSSETLGLPTGFYNMRCPAITTRGAALAALDQVIDEGEGTKAGRHSDADLDRCHYGRLLAMRRQYLDGAKRARRQRRRFDPVRAVAANPAVDRGGSGPGVTVVTFEAALDFMRLFDFGYQTLLMFLIRVYSHRDESQHEFRAERTAAFWPLMTLFVRPIGELLTELPATDRRDGPRAGPGFRLSPAVLLLPDPRVAATLLHERLVHLAAETVVLTRRHGRRLPAWWRPRLELLGRDLQRCAANFARQAGLDA